MFLLLIERSSTKLHAPPGGRTSIIFGDGSDDRFTEKYSTHKKAAPMNARGAENNMRNIINQQDQQPAANNRRVRQAPGGTSSIVIG